VLADWRRRLDRIVVVIAPDELKMPAMPPASAQTGAGREAAKADARLRLARQIPNATQSRPRRLYHGKCWR